MPARAHRPIAFAVVLVVLVVVAATAILNTRQDVASSSPTSVRTPRQPSLAMIGDSVTYAAVPDLARAFADAGWASDIEAHPGDMFRDRQTIAEQLAARRPDIVVINLGTNDELCLYANRPDSGSLPCRFPAFTPGDATADMQAMLELFPMDRTCVVGILPTFAPGVTALWRFRELHDGVSGLADWGTETRTHTETLKDLVGHLSDVGIERYATFVADNVQRICAPTLDAIAAG